MAGSPISTSRIKVCPFCGMAAQLPHETQAACIAALHAEIGRTKDILASLTPAGTRHHQPDPHRRDPHQPNPNDGEDQPASIRLVLSDNDLV